MKIAEMFCSIQGEGTLVGVPSLFLRASGCNLRCVWCDTPYASWRPEGQHMTVDEIVGYVAEHATGYVVLTGGEPMIMPDVVPLTEKIRELGQHITIETAGTVFSAVACDLMSISPKLSNSTPRGPEAESWTATHERLRLQPDVLRRLMADYDYQLKFVVSTTDDLPEIQALLEELEAERTRVLLMPEGTSPDVLRERAQWLVEICKREGFRYSPRLHIDIYGDRRGV